MSEVADDQGPAGHSEIFRVAPLDDIWVISRNDRRLKLRLTLALAVTDAVKAAICAHKHGMQSEVLFSSGKETYSLWRNGQLISENAGVLDSQRAEARN